MDRLLIKHFIESKEKLLAFYKHSSLGKHPNNIGYAREGFIQYFLKDNLPISLQYGSGEIIDKYDNRSGQNDIVLQSSNSPRIKLFGDVNVYFSDHVLCCIEVKSTLNKDHFDMCLNSSREIKNLHRDRYISVKRSQKVIEYRSIPYIVFAYNGKNSQSILDQINNSKCKNDELPDLIVNISKNYVLIKNNYWLLEVQNVNDGKYILITGKDCLIYLYQYIYLLIEAESLGNTKGYMELTNFLN